MDKEKYVYSFEFKEVNKEEGKERNIYIIGTNMMEAVETAYEHRPDGYDVVFCSKIGVLKEKKDA